MSRTNSLSRAQALLQQVDLLIAKHEKTQPELARDLLALRAELEIALRRRDAQEMSLIALRIASWARYVFDFLSDD